jgi:hypothetical protein
LERLFLLVYPMVDFVALKRTALTTPFFETICLLFVSCFVYIFSDIHLFTFFSCFFLHLAPYFWWWIWFKVEIEWCLFLEGTVLKFFLVFWFSFEKFQFFCRNGNFWFSIEGIISHCGRVEKGKSVRSGAFLELHSFRFDRVVLTGHWHFS